jgi:hypothetical protein
MERLVKNSVIVILLFGTAIYLSSCAKKETPPTPPVVTTTNVSDITQTTALIEGTVVNDGGTEITDIGICWSTSPGPTISSNKTTIVSASNPFNSSITGLTADTKYYVRAFATNSTGTSYGNEVTFTTINITKATTIPTLTTTDITSITSTTAVSGGTITDDGGGDITSRGVYWNRTPGYDIYPDEITANGIGPGSFVSYLSNLSPGKTYYVKAYAVNSAGIAFGPALSFTTSFEQSGGLWIKKADFPPQGGRYDAAGFSIGPKIYLGLGYDWDDNNQNDFWEWDQATNVWTKKADFPGNFTGKIVCFSIGTKGYLVVLNYNYINSNSSTNDLWEYDPATNGWTQKASLPYTSASGVRVAFSVGTKGYVGSGYDDAFHAARDFWEWDQATNVWTKKEDYPGNSTVGAVGFSIGTKGYIGTGRGYGYTLYNDFWEWDQATNVWTKKADFGGTPRGNAVGFSIGTKGYIGTGYNSKDFWEWDQATNVWTQKANFGGIARSSAVGYSIGNKGYIGTGMGSGFGNEYAIKDLWEYDPNLK